MTHDAEVGEVHLGQVDLGRAPGPLQHDDVGTLRQTVVGGTDEGPQSLGPLPPRRLGEVPVDLAQDGHLTAGVSFGFEEDGVVVHAGQDACGQRLEVLRGTDLATICPRKGSAPSVPP